MKTMIYLMALAFIFTACTTVPPKEDIIPLEMAMKYMKEIGVTSVSISDFEYEYGVPRRVGKKILEVKFNDKYLITESTIFKEGAVAGKIVYNYNLNGDTLKVTKYNELDFELARTEYIYNSVGKVVEKKYFEEGIMFKNDVFDYGENGLISEFKHYEKNKLDYFIKYTYDSQNREIEWMRYNKEGVPEQKGTSQFNEKGLKTDSIYYFSGIVDIKVKYDYDNKDRLTMQTIYTGDGNLYSKTEYKYNPIGQISEKNLYDYQNVLVRKYEYEYEKHGQYKQVKIYKEGGFLDEIWKFKYDEANFLPKHQEFLNNIEVPKKVRRYYFESSKN
ncbi:hypothetical protein D9V86_04730 [Bacteroidetes/Chlorobi group bacterium ChocPot_Mid]|nr:MAG: hypothetical protein D9V86_04730 [Bacteroidetes/Chlorobi group bacterium ChocPot_Mid]